MNQEKAEGNEHSAGSKFSEREMKGAELFAGLAHTVQTPLQSIILNTEMLLELMRQVENPRIREKGVRILSRINRETNSLKTLLKDFLALARMTAGKKLPTDINSLIREVVEFVRNECLQFNVELYLNLDKSVYPVVIDRQLFSHALLNLIKNATESIRNDGTIVITSRETSDSLEISVADDGPGVTPEKEETIFDPFISTKPGGTGLGLSIVRRIMQVHGGVVFLSHNRDTGAEFVLRIPKGKFIGDPPDPDGTTYEPHVDDILRDGFGNGKDTK